jgi:hypothetical protein
LFVNNIAPKGEVWDQFILPNTSHFLSSRAGFHFLKFCEHMLRTLKGEGTGKRGQRPDLIAEYGYDCYDDEQTEFLTDAGWKVFDDVGEKDKVAAFDIYTGEIRFETPTERVDKKFYGPMYTIEPALTRCVVTPNHNMAVSPAHRNAGNAFSTSYNEIEANWELVSLSKIMSGYHSMHHIRRSAAKRQHEYPIETEYLQLAGMFVSEGSINFRNNKTGKVVKAARLSQTSNGKQEFFTLADSLSSKFGIRRYDYKKETVFTVSRNIAERLYSDFGHHKNKHLPQWSLYLSYEQANIFWDALCLGDGTVIKEERGEVYYTSVKRLADGIHAMMVSSGHVCVLNGPYGPYEKPKTEFGNTEMYQIYRPKDQNPYCCINLKSGILHHNQLPDPDYGYPIKETIVTEKRIVCFEMPSRTLVTRSAGRPAFQGNTKAAMHLIRVLNEGIELMETGKITLPRPEKDFLIDIRLGQAGKLADIDALAQERFARLDAAQKASFLPTEVDRKSITQVITAAQLNVWNHRNEVLRVLGKAVGIAAWWISEDCKLHPPTSSSIIGQGSWVGNPKAVEKDLIALAFEFYNEENKQRNGLDELPVDE